ncbi:hypothetical protein J3R83DRAFT_8462 [Lanmaoa asiatica]|nr:hypothetical protein J3R83DRAFT_8462 [Lanmaoa asiatica]
MSTQDIQSPVDALHTDNRASSNELSPNPWADAPTKLDLHLSSAVQGLSLPDTTNDSDALDARSAWADAQSHPPPPRPDSGQSIRGHSRSSTHDLSRRPPSRPSSPGPPVSSPAFSSFAAIARSFSIPSVVRPRTRPLSMDSAKPIPTTSPTTLDSFAAQQQQPSPLSKPLPLQPDAAPSPHSAPTTRPATPPLANDGTTPRRDKDPQFDFQTFLDQMKSRGAEPVANFLSNFTKRTFTVNDQVKVINDFLNFIVAKMRESDVWRNASDAEFENATEGMEKLVMNKLYDFTFTPSLPLLTPPRPVTADDLERDRILAQRISLFRWIKPSHLDIPELESTEPGIAGFLEFAQQELCKVNHYKAPRDKLICILNCCKVIFGLLRHLRKDEGADSFVPVLIFVVLRANPDQLLSNVEFISRFRNPAKLQSEAGYYLSSLMGAVQFIETMDHTSVSNITQQEFERNVELAIQSLPPSLPSSPTSSTSSFAPSTRSPFPSPHAGEESAQPLALSVPSQTQSIGEDARRLLQKTGNVVSKPLGAISRIFSDALDEKMSYLPGPFAPFELARERAQEGSDSQTERHWAHPDQIAQFRLGGGNTPKTGQEASKPPIQTTYKPRVRRPSPAPPPPGGAPFTVEDTSLKPTTAPRAIPGAVQAPGTVPWQDVGATSGTQPSSLPQRLQPPSQAQHISRTPTPSLDLSAVQAEIDRAHAHASAASRSTLAQIFPSMDAEVRDWVLEANGGDLGKSIEALLEMSGGS